MLPDPQTSNPNVARSNRAGRTTPDADRRTGPDVRRTRLPALSIRGQVKACLYCCTDFPPRYNETVTTWSARRFCRSACAVRYRWKDQPVRYRRMGTQYAHRAVMERILGRRLRRKEVVHHKDGNRLNNDPLNLEVTNQFDHMQHHRKYPRTISCKVCAREVLTNGKPRRFCSSKCHAIGRHHAADGRFRKSA